MSDQFVLLEVKLEGEWRELLLNRDHIIYAKDINESECVLWLTTRLQLVVRLSLQELSQILK